MAAAGRLALALASAPGLAAPGSRPRPGESPRLARPGGLTGAPRRPGAALAARLREMERLEAEMRLLIHDD